MFLVKVIAIEKTLEEIQKLQMKNVVQTFSVLDSVEILQIANTIIKNTQDLHINKR